MRWPTSWQSAEQYRVDKAQVMMDDDGKKGTSAAAKLALGETEISVQTKKFLEQEGVSLDAFNKQEAGQEE